MFENTENLEELLFSQKELFGEKGTKRLHLEEKVRERGSFERDYSRVLYSSSFRRLQGKMQLMTVDDSKFNRNRLTHSLEVAQIARSIAEKLQNKIDDLELDFQVYTRESIYVVEAAALAHDIGNAPFGHHGEKVLGDLMEERGGYEGNAQSLRILMNIEKKHPHVAGLNLTVRTLLSIIKYNVVNNGSAAKFLYMREYTQLINYLRKYELATVMRTIDAQIIDAADEIAYCAHDLEDVLAQNYFSIDEFLFDLKANEKDNDISYKDEIAFFEDIVVRAKERAKNSRVYKVSEEYSAIFRKELTSILVDELIRDLDVLSVDKELKDDFRVKTGTTRKYEIAFKHWRLVRALKYWTFEGINRNSKIQMYEKLGTKVIRGLFEAFTDKNFNDNMFLMPVEYRSNFDNKNNVYRKVADYIGGMMDPSAIEAYGKIYGNNETKKIYDGLIYNKENKH